MAHENSDIIRAIGRLEGKLDGVMSEQTRITRYLETASVRLRSVESKQNRIYGWAAGVAAVVTLLFSVLSDFFLPGRSG